MNPPTSSTRKQETIVTLLFCLVISPCFSPEKPRLALQFVSPLFLLQPTIPAHHRSPIPPGPGPPSLVAGPFITIRFPLFPLPCFASASALVSIEQSSDDEMVICWVRTEGSSIRASVAKSWSESTRPGSLSFGFPSWSRNSLMSVSDASSGNAP